MSRAFENRLDRRGLISQMTSDLFVDEAQYVGLSNTEACRMDAVRVFVASQCKSMTYAFLLPKFAERMQKERRVLR